MLITEHKTKQNTINTRAGIFTQKHQHFESYNEFLVLSRFLLLGIKEVYCPHREPAVASPVLHGESGW